MLVAWLGQFLEPAAVGSRLMSYYKRSATAFVREDGNYGVAPHVTEVHVPSLPLELSSFRRP